MTMMTRLARLVRADLNAVLDRLEAPELVLAQAVRDMEQALEGERRAVAELDRELARLARRDAVLSDEEARDAQSIAAALEGSLAPDSTAGGDALLRPIVRRRLQTSRRRAGLKSRIAETQAERDRLAARTEGHAARLDELRSRAALAAPSLADQGLGDPTDPRWRAPGESDWSTSERPVEEAEIELELLRLRRAAAGRGGDQ